VVIEEPTYCRPDNTASTWTATGVRTYVLGPLPDERLIWMEGRGADRQVSYPHTDRRGSTIALSRGGQAVATYAYDEYGQGRAQDGVTGYPFRYTGQRLDPWTDTYHYKAREYSPQLGRFLQPDPARFVDGPNVYAYVGNNPWNAVDPTGRRTQDGVEMRDRIALRQRRTEAETQAAADTAEQVGNYVREHPGESLELTGQLIGLIPTPQTRVAGAGISGIGRAYRDYNGTAVPTTPPTLGGPGAFRNQGLLERHFVDHGQDFGPATISDYHAAANRFLTGERGLGTLERTRSNQDVVRYNTITEQFGVISGSGTIRTYFRPDPRTHGYRDNLEYFNAQ